MQQESASLELWSSVIAITGSPNNEYIQENDTENDFYEAEEEFVCKLSNGFTLPIQGTNYQMKQLNSFLSTSVNVSAKSPIQVSTRTLPDLHFVVHFDKT